MTDVRVEMIRHFDHLAYVLRMKAASAVGIDSGPNWDQYDSYMSEAIMMEKNAAYFRSKDETLPEAYAHDDPSYLYYNGQVIRDRLKERRNDT